MEEGGGGVVALTPTTNNSISSVVTQLQTKCKELENGFRGALQGAAVEIGVVTGVTGICALAGASFGVLFGSLAQLQAVNNVVPLNRILGSTRVIARNNAVLAATYGGVSCVMKRIRGKEDVKAAMVAGFCSGFMFDLVYNIPPVDAIKTGLFVAVLNGLVLK
ncbi:hypothetical protein MKW94_001448, partial [Papaver nudicaule]|nr:hypothetical protein [Papaver nudicaule]